MATVAPPRTASSTPQRAGAHADGQGGSEAIIAERIAEAQSALWRAELSRSLLIPVIALLIGITIWAVVDQWVWSPGKLVRTLALVSAMAALAGWAVRRVRPLLGQHILPEYAAQSLEHDLPELRHSLTSYVSLRDDHELAGVRGVVVRSIGVRAASQLQRNEIEVPSEATGNLGWWLGVAGAIALTAAYAALSPKNTLQSAQRLLLPMAAIDAPSRVQISDVMPGTIEVLAGRSFEVSAMIDGLAKNDQPLVEFGPGFVDSRPLELNAESGRHLVSISIDSDTHYRIVAGDSIAGPYQVTTRDVPNVLIEQVEISPPEYTKLSPRSSSGGAIVGEENAIATIVARTNRPIERARIEFNPRAIGDSVQAAGGVRDMKLADGGTGVSASFPLRLPTAISGGVPLESYRIHVWDAAGNENPEPIVYPIRIVADLAPEVTISSPQAVVTAMPINAAQRIEVQSLDPDYGLKLIELQIQRGLDLLKTETLWSSVEGERGNQNSVWILSPKSLSLRVGETVQVRAVASDNRHDSSGIYAPNITTTDWIELKVVAPQENDKLPRFDDQPAENPESKAGQDSQPDASNGKSGDKNQTGQGGAGQGTSEANEAGKNQSGNGSPSQGQPADDSNASPAVSEMSENGGSDSADSKPASNSKPSMSNKPAGESGQPPSGDSTQEPSPDGSAGGRPEENSATGEAAKNANAGDQSGPSSPQKPQHDGEAMERIRDHINESKQNQSSKGGDGQSADGKQTTADDSQGKQSDGQQGKPDSSTGDKPEAGPGKPEAGPGKSKAGPGKSEAGSGKPEAGSGKPEGEPGKPEGSQDNPAGSQSSNQQGQPAASAGEDGSKSGDQVTKPDGQQGEPAAGQHGNPDGSQENNSAGQPDTGNETADPQDSRDSTKVAEAGQAGDGRVEQSDAPGEAAKPSQSDPTADSGKPSQSSEGNPTANHPDAGTPGDKSTSTGDPGGNDLIQRDPPEDQRPSDPVDVEHARQATDLVLDYLNNQRDKPDPELLEKLDWSADDLRAFTDRWNRLRTAEQNPGADAKQIDQALRSLGIRSDQRGPIGRATDSDDALRGLKDAGNRRPAPAIHRDAFDAFRRNANRQ